VDRIVAIIASTGLADTSQDGEHPDPHASGPEGDDETRERPILLLRPSMPSLPEAERLLEQVPADEEPPPAAVAHTGTKVQEERDQARDEQPPRRRGALQILLSLLFLSSGAVGGYLRAQAGAWPFAAVRPKGVAPDPSPSTSTAPAVPVVSAATSAVASSPAASTGDAGSITAASPDAGVEGALTRASGTRRGPVRTAGPPHDRANGGPVVAPVDVRGSAGTSSAPPVPASALKPEVISETCYQTFPDGTRSRSPVPETPRGRVGERPLCAHRPHRT
jgi:hypothetical protein